MECNARITGERLHVSKQKARAKYMKFKPTYNEDTEASSMDLHLPLNVTLPLPAYFPAVMLVCL